VSTPLDYEASGGGFRRTYASVALLSAVLFFLTSLPLIAPDLHNNLEPILMLPWLALGASTFVFREIAAHHGRSHPNAAFQQRRAVTMLLVSGAVIGGLGAAGKIFGADPHDGTRSRMKCESNLRQIGLAMLLYANANGGTYPQTIDQLLVFHWDDITPELFCCPAANDTPAAGPTTRAVVSDLLSGGHLSYVYLGGRFRDPAPTDAVLAYEPPGVHGGNVMNVLFGDGHTESVSQSQAELLLAKLHAGHNPP